MSIKVSGGGGGGGYPGVTADGGTPGGLNVAGSEKVAKQLVVGGTTIDPTGVFAANTGDGSSGLAYGEDGDLSVSHRSGQHSTETIAGQRLRNPTFPYGGPMALLVDFSAEGNDLVFIQSFDADGHTLLGQLSISSVAAILTSHGLGLWSHAAPAAQPTLATGASHTVDDVITLLQSYGLCKQS